jgi:hypothetical protein
MPKWRQGNNCNDASAVMMPALRRQQWQRRQGNVRDDTSAATATMPKRRQGDLRDDASTAMTPASGWQQWQQRQGNIRNDASAATATLAMAPGRRPR